MKPVYEKLFLGRRLANRRLQIGKHRYKAGHRGLGWQFKKNYDGFYSFEIQLWSFVILATY